jgi:hypothetical protein
VNLGRTSYFGRGSSLHSGRRSSGVSGDEQLIERSLEVRSGDRVFEGFCCIDRTSGAVAGARPPLTVPSHSGTISALRSLTDVYEDLLQEPIGADFEDETLMGNQRATVEFNRLAELNHGPLIAELGSAVNVHAVAG